MDGSKASDRDLSDIVEALLTGGRDPLGKAERLMRIASDVLSNPPKGDDDSAASTGKGFTQTFAQVVSLALEHPDRLAQHLSAFAGQAIDILRQSQDIDLEPSPRDRRFRDPLWRTSPVLRGLMQLYLSWNLHVQDWLDALDIDTADRLRIQFLVDQMKAALSPTNLPLHPVAIKRAEESGGRSAVQGLKNFALDLQTNRGMPRQINPGAYVLGETLAITPGAVVFRNAQLELIQYAAQTDRVHLRPILLIPPQINKYYAFDLKPQNSVLGYLVQQGFQVFTISWKNPGNEAAEWGLETYISASLQAILAIQTITGTDKVNLISACAGGLTAMSLIGHLAHARSSLVASHSLLVTALYPGNGSILEAFTTSENLELARRISAEEGTMDGLDLAHLFVWLRPDDLVWSFWVNNNILGRQPPPLDVLYWDNDPTKVPARLHSDFIDIFLRDVFRQPGRQILFGRPMDYSVVEVPTYFVGGLEDYLMPWRGIYRAVNAFGGQNRFVLSTSGHVQSILRPPNLAGTEFFVNSSHPADPDHWLRDADRRAGTWWVDWSEWLRRHVGNKQEAPREPGCPAFPPICPAPGTYAKERMSV
jgi:polyhydroxyalkanoate synthase subunit PhaC